MLDSADLVYRLIGKRVRAARDATRPHVSQARLAELLGMTRASVVNIEAGRQRAPVHVLWSIAEALDVEFGSLLPTRAEYEQAVTPVKLDDETVATIEAAANGDTSAKESLMAYISRAKAQLAAEQGDDDDADD